MAGDRILSPLAESTSPLVRGDLLQRIEGRTATIGVIGMGYVGLPLALIFAENSFPVLGFDIDQSKVDALTRGTSYIKHIGVDRVANAFLARGAKSTSDFAHLGSCDVVIICVPTPLGPHREPELKYIRMTA